MSPNPQIGSLSKISDLKFEIRDMDPDPETPNRKPEAWDLTPQTSNLKLSFSKNQRPSRPCCHHSEPAHLFEAQTARNARFARFARFARSVRTGSDSDRVLERESRTEI